MYPLQFLETWNIVMFQLLRGTPGSPAAAILAATWLAELPVYVACAILLWAMARRKDWMMLLPLSVACLAARLLEILAAAYAYHARPFAAGFGPPLTAHAANNSLPSSHVAFVWLLAVVSTRWNNRRLTAVLAVLGGAVAWARVFVGVHWPLDVVASAVTAAVCGAAGLALQRLAAVRFPASSSSDAQ
ncbi:phosphatase PAP2 family protein [Bordetella petrii]|uniref:phosphatase PAP2 family protein n=1 Tax=Bordetella petrii TaxID=94624 RepID=UPI001E59CB43|nr:phosphatase PAP2 family protein [Bordetella petrii]MCD0502187.1 phosphatase PAP2 family protein [Bordetella petrii]